MKARFLKIGAAVLAYVPMLVLILDRESGTPAGQAVVVGCAIFNSPALVLLMFIQTFHVSHQVELSILLMLVWSSCVAGFFWRVVGEFLERDDIRRGQFDWIGFQFRFAIGFIMGCLVGWRFVRDTTSMKTLLIASVVTGCIGGLLYGLSRPPDFWSRS